MHGFGFFFEFLNLYLLSAFGLNSRNFHTHLVIDTKWIRTLCPRIKLYKKTFEKFLDGEKTPLKRYPSGV